MTKALEKSMPKTSAKPLYRRILLKISGEALMGGRSYGQDAKTVERICRDIKSALDIGIEVCLVVGGGNIFRGIEGAASGMERASADYMGMLATVLNALAIQNTLERMNIDTRVLSAITMTQICEPYIRRRAIRHMERGRVVIFAAGTGNPFFTTDTAAALRAVEIEADVLLKGTHGGVDGVYSADPRTDPTATRFDEISFKEMLDRDLRVMDLTAITFCQDNELSILVFDVMTPGNVGLAVAGERIGTLIG
ncbi:MAG TPA: UMP kinase, partial [Acidimicrobiales bacterium]|nr:UMP kinase [Acidimicrobiales bacterium]